ncbi:MAG: polyprenyl synthetase family protein [Phycisphaerales bacterium]|nr:polyprenyl synthetase family protein [Phycisphaerales bacterium]
MQPPPTLSSNSSQQADHHWHSRLPQGLTSSARLADTLLEDWCLDNRVPRPLLPAARLALFPGSRIRPAILLALCREIGAAPMRHLALSIELLHRSSLVIDDMIDSATTRSNHPTVWAAYGSETAALLSHYLVGQALANSSTYLLAAYNQMISSESFDLADAGLHPSFGRYCSLMSRRVGSLFDVVATTPFHEVGHSREKLRPIRRAARLLGVLYQVVDDLDDNPITSASDREWQIPVRACDRWNMLEVARRVSASRYQSNRANSATMNGDLAPLSYETAIQVSVRVAGQWLERLERHLGSSDAQMSSLWQAVRFVQCRLEEAATGATSRIEPAMALASRDRHVLVPGLANA